tara:strand:- start:393 stop:2492 length:2100 start_codon:yes stop_codon:yes gene_type:complete
MPSIDRQIAFGMSTVRYRTTPNKADLIENMVVTNDGTLCSMTGPTVYEPRHVFSKAPTDLGQVHSIFHGYFNGGEKEVLLAHAGSNLWYHVGAKKGWVALTTPRLLSNDTEKTVYSSFVKFADLIIFSDGSGPPIVINDYLTVTLLGFTQKPSSLAVKGPESTGQADNKDYGEGALGYSWPGGLGSSSRRLNGTTPHILKGTWRWCVRYQDFYGNYSPLSDRSAEIEYGPKDTQEFRVGELQVARIGGSDNKARPIQKVNTTIKSLRRAAAITIPDDVPDNCKLIQIGRTKDTERNDSDFYLVKSLGSSGGVFHDRRKDAGLTQKMTDNFPVPVIESMLVDNGRLMVLSGPYVYFSDPGFPGTYNIDNRLMITADGREGSALFSLQGKRYAATQYSIIDVTELTNPIVVTNLVGIAGPKSWTYLPGQTGIVFVSMSGVYSLSGDGLSKLSDDINHFWDTEVNRVRLDFSIVWYSLKRKEVRIALAPAGDISNKLILAYSDLGWRTYRLSVSVNCFAYIDEMEAIGGNDGQSRTGQYTAHDVYILEKESPVYTPPARQAIYESDYIPLDEALGFVRGKVLTMYFGFIETYADTGADVEYEINYDSGIAETHKIRLEDTVGVDIMDGGTRRHSWGSILIGTDNFQEKRKVYRKARIDLTNANRFKFTVKCDYPVMLELVDYLFEFNVEAKPGNREVDVLEV